MIETPRNAFKDALTQRKLCLGLWLGLPDAYCAELCAGCGYDWLLVDGEHAPNDLRSILAILQAVAPYRSHPVVRIPEGNVTLIKQVMELGATTLLVPMVESAERARELVRAMRYPPEGVRGVGSGLARSSRWNGYSSYLVDANDRACLLVQVETQAALDRAREIANVDGVDGVFIGPADLSASMGFLGQPAHPQVRERIGVAISAILEAGKAPGILCTDESLAHTYVGIGAQFIAIGVDTTLLANAAKSLVARFRSGTRGLSDDSSSPY
jgi:4-hydroxy-2-oxoheptanedioate aldolase